VRLIGMTGIARQARRPAAVLLVATLATACSASVTTRLAGAVQTAHAGPRVASTLPHYRLVAHQRRGCVVGRGELTVYQNSVPRRLCMREGASLQLVLSDPGVGGQWIEPTITGTAATPARFDRIGGSDAVILRAATKGRSRLVSGVSRPLGSELSWAMTIRVTPRSQSGGP
jgi:hypothetical protein